MKLELILTTGADGYSPSEERLIIESQQKDYFVDVLRFSMPNYKEEITSDSYTISSGNMYAMIKEHEQKQSFITLFIENYEANKEND